jgi:hypothetical protein
MSTLSTWKSEEGRELIVGYFGPATLTADKVVCARSVGYTFSQYAAAGTSGSSPLTFVSGPPRADAVSFEGGQLATSTNCANAETNAMKKILIINPSLLDNGGLDSVQDFRGPFTYDFTQNSSGNMSLATKTFSDAGVHLEFIPLPGVNSSTISGYSVFKYAGGDFHFHSEGAPCTDLANNNVVGFSKLTDFSAGADGEKVSFDANIPAAERATTNLVICPKVGAGYSNAAAMVYSGELVQFNGGCTLGNCGGAVATAIGITRYAPNPANVAQGQCSEFVAYFTTAQGQTASYGSIVNLRATSNGTSVPAYSDAGCTSVLSQGLALGNGSSGEFHFFLPSPASGSLWNVGLQYFGTAGSLTLPAPFVANLKNATDTYLLIQVPNQVLPAQCYQMRISHNQYNGNMAPAAMFTALVTAGIADVQFYASQSTCLNNSAPLSVTSVQGATTLSTSFNNETEKLFYFKLPSAANNLDVLFTAAKNGGGAVFPDAGSAHVYATNGDTTISRLNILGPANLGIGTCTKMDITFANTNWLSVVATASTSLNVTATGLSGIQFYADSACTGVVSFPVAIPTGSDRFEVFVKVPAAAQGQIHANLASNSSVTADITIGVSNACGNCGGSPTQILLSRIAMPKDKVAYSQCSAFRASVADGSGLPAMFNTDLTLRVRNAGALANYSTQPDCGGTTISNLIIPDAQGYVDFYLPAPSTGSNWQISVEYLTSGPLTLPASPLTLTLRNLSDTLLVLDGPKKIALNSCYEMSIEHRRYDLQLAAYSGSLNLNGPTGVLFYGSASTCDASSTPITTLSFASENTKKFYVKATNGSLTPPLNLTVAPTSGTFPDSGQWALALASTAGPLASFDLRAMGNIPTGQCMPLAVRFQDQSLTSIELTSSQSISFTTPGLSGVGFYTNQTDCGSGTNALTSYTVPSGSDVYNLWIKSSATGTGHLHVNLTSDVGKYGDMGVTFVTPP